MCEHIAAAGGLGPLVTMMRSQNPQVAQQATHAISNLALISDALKSLISNAKAMPVLVSLLRSGNDGVVETAAMALRNLVAGRDTLKSEVRHRSVPALYVLYAAAAGCVQEQAPAFYPML